MMERRPVRRYGWDLSWIKLLQILHRALTSFKLVFMKGGSNWFIKIFLWE